MKKRFLTKLLAIVMSVGLVLHPVAVYAEDPVEGDVPATILDVDQDEGSGDESGGSGDGAGVEDPDQDPDYVPEQNQEENPDYVPPVDNNQDPNAAPSNNPEELVGDEEDGNESDAAAEQDSVESEEDAEEEEEALLTLGATRGVLVNISNMRIEGDYILWDEVGGAGYYKLEVAGHSSVGLDRLINLRSKCEYWNLDYGTYDVTVTALAQSGEKVSRPCTVSYTYSEKAKQVLDLSTVHVEGNLLYWETSQESLGYRLDIGDDLKAIFVDGMPFDLADCCHDKGLEAGAYKMRFYALDTNNKYTEAYEFEFNYVPKKTLIKSVSVQTNASDIAKLDGKRTDAQVTNSETPEVIVGFYRWLKVKDDGTDQSYYGTTFTPGKYRIELTAYLDPDYADSFEIDKGLQLVIDGVACDYYTVIVWNGSRNVYYFKSGEYTVEDTTTPLPELQNVRIEGDYLYWDLLDGADMYNITIGHVSDNYLSSPVNLAEMCKSLGIQPGTYEVKIVAIDGDMDDLSEEAVAGEYTYSEEPEKTLIQSATVETNASSIVQLDGEVTNAQITNIDRPELVVEFVRWYKVNDKGLASEYSGKTFTPGKYKIMLSVSLDPKYVDKFVIDEKAVLIIDGATCKCFSIKNKSGPNPIYNFVSGAYTVEETTITPTKTKITSVSVQTNVSSILKIYGENKAVQITNNDRPEVVVEFYRWIEIQENGPELYYDEATFAPGKYRVSFYAYLDPEYADSYEIDKGLQLVIDGITCNCLGKFDVNGRISYRFESGEYTVDTSALPKLQNVRIDGNYISWDSFERAYMYRIAVNGDTRWTTSTSYNLRSMFTQLNYEYGTYTIRITANDSDYNQISSAYEIEYAYEEQILPKIQNVCVEGDNLYWDAIGGAYNYQVSFDGKNYHAYQSSFGIRNAFDSKKNEDPDFDYGNYIVKITALDKEGIPLSETYEFEYTYEEPIIVLPELQNVRIEGDYLYWDLLDGADMYTVTIGRQGNNYNNSPLNLYDECSYLNMQPGTYEVKIVAINVDMEDLSGEAVAGEYTYSPKEKAAITKIAATSDISDFMVDGGQLKAPSFTSDMDEFVTFSGFYWQIKDGDEWKVAGNSGPVSEGIYRYTTYVYIKSSSSKTHRFSTDLALFVDNQEWICSSMVDNNGDLPVMASFISPEIEVKGSSTPDPEPEKQALTSVTAASDYSSLAKYGGTVQDPSFDIAEIKASESDVSGAAPITISGRWYRKEGNAWAEQLDGTFTAGTWRYEVDVNIKSDAVESYEFDSSFKLTVNSEQWHEILGFGGQSATERTFISKEIEIKEDTPEPVPTEISTVTATSNMTDLFAGGKTIDSGVKYTVDGGYASITGMYWQKYVEGSWEIAQRYGNEFNPGTYRIQVIVTVNDADYYLAEDVGLVVDGVNYVFQQAGIRNGSYLMNAYFASPEMEIKDSSSTGGDDNNGGNNDNGGGNQSNPSSNQGGGQSSGGSSDGEIPADAVTITTTASTPTGTDAAGPAVLGANRNNAASRTVKIKKGKLTDAQFKSVVIDNIMKTPDGGTLRLEVEWLACFDREMLKAFEKKATINLEVVFPYKNSRMTVTIPAGFDINKLLDKKGYCGFLRLASIIPAKAEDKFEG